MKKTSVWALAFLALLSLGACSSARQDAQPTTFPRLAFTAPPAPLYEEPPQLDNPQLEIWVPGYWAFNGRDFSWVPGRVIEKPAPYAVWSADRWELRTFGWSFVPGFWI